MAPCFVAFLSPSNQISVQWNVNKLSLVWNVLGAVWASPGVVELSELQLRKRRQLFEVFARSQSRYNSINDCHLPSRVCVNTANVCFSMFLSFWVRRRLSRFFLPFSMRCSFFNSSCVIKTLSQRTCLGSWLRSRSILHFSSLPSDRRRKTWVVVDRKVRVAKALSVNDRSLECNLFPVLFSSNRAKFLALWFHHKSLCNYDRNWLSFVGRSSSQRGEAVELVKFRG